MSFRLVPKSVTLNDLERRNGRYFALFQQIFMYDVAVNQGSIIFLGDHDFPLTGSNFGNLTAFMAIFSHIFTAIRGRFLMIFALDTLNVRHISTSALVDLLT